MTIKQLGGVFGRNPTFNDVTIEGQLTFDGDIDINSDLTIDGVLNVEGETNIKANSGSLSHKFSYNENGGEISLYDNASAQATLIDQSNNTTRMLELVDGSNMEIGLGGGNTTGYVQFKSAGYANAMRITSNKNVEIQDGDLVIGTSGHGIDFSATSGTGTSELFDDYEEGTWSPVYIPQIGSFTTMTMDISNAKYTKVGRFVYVQASILTDNVDITGGSGGLRLSGLPFSSSGFGSFVISYAQAWGGDVPLYGYIENGSTYANLRYRSSVNGADSAMLVNDLSTGAVANQNYMIISGVYTAS